MKDTESIKTDSKNLRWQSLGQLIKFCLAAILAIIGISLAVAAGRFSNAFNENALELAPYPQLSIILLLITFALVGLWYFATEGELRMLRLYAFDFIPSLPNINIQVIVFVLILGSMAYFSNLPIVYSSIFGAFKLIEVWLLWIRDNKIKEGIKQAHVLSSSSVDKSYLARIDIIEKYYLGRPHIPLNIFVLCLAFIALVFSVYGVYGENERIMFSLAYSLLIFGICINETTFYIWRKIRDKELGDTFSL